MRAPRTAALALAALALPALSGCDLFDRIEDLLGQPSTQELEALSTLVDCDVRAASTGGTTTGSLASGDCRLNDDSFADYYAFRLPNAATVELRLESSDFDAYLILADQNANEIEEDDDGGGGTNARISRRLNAGLYLVVANSFESGETGSYRLRIERAD